MHLKKTMIIACMSLFVLSSGAMASTPCDDIPLEKMDEFKACIENMKARAKMSSDAELEMQSIDTATKINNKASQLAAEYSDGVTMDNVEMGDMGGTPTTGVASAPPAPVSTPPAQ